MLNQTRTVRADTLSYLLLNFVGASLACYSSWLIDFIPFVMLEGVWAAVALAGTVRVVVSKTAGRAKSSVGS